MVSKFFNTAGYMDCVGDVREGHFILFNRDKGVSWEDKLWHRRETPTTSLSRSAPPAYSQSHKPSDRWHCAPVACGQCCGGG